MRGYYHTILHLCWRVTISYWSYEVTTRIDYRNVRFTDISKISVLKPISVYQYEFFGHISDISEFFDIPFTHPACGEIVNFCFTQMQSK
jgi:hypothetical protein